jgi:hypothetical protein
MNRALPGSGGEARHRIAAARMLVFLSCIHALLFLLSYALLTSTPGPRASDEELTAFYSSGSRIRLVLVGLYVMPFAGISFLWLGSALRAWIRAAARAEDGFVAGLQQASGIIYVALFFGAAAASSVTAVSVQFSNSPLDPMLARQFPQFGQALLLVFAMRMAAMFVFTTARLAHLAGALPRWFEYVGLAAGLFLLLNTAFNRALVLVFPLWLLFLCVLIGARASGAGSAPGVQASPEDR